MMVATGLRRNVTSQKVLVFCFRKVWHQDPEAAENLMNPSLALIKKEEIVHCSLGLWSFMHTDRK